MKKVKPKGWTSISYGISRLLNDTPSALVAVVYSSLRAAQQGYRPATEDLQQRELEKLDLDGSVPFWRRATQAQSLWSLALFITAGGWLRKQSYLLEIMTPLGPPGCLPALT
ncbi:MAG: hypothetical protein IPM39_21660 [Chloroflexi bacterium]|nr:hypothetical protein [Chloroflexota bacterium]